DPGFDHRLGDTEPLPGVPDGELEAGRLAAGQFAQPLDELQQADRGGEGAVLRWRHALHPRPHAPGQRDLPAHLGGRQHPAVAGLGALRQLDLDHPDLRVPGILREALGAEVAVLVTAAEVARADLPYQVAAVLPVAGRDRAFAGVVVEAAHPLALV